MVCRLEVCLDFIIKLSLGEPRGSEPQVDIMVPHHLHEQIALQCFQAGKHVLLEKPIAPNLEACARIVEAARKSGKRFMVAEQAQYWGFVLEARKLIQQGAIGRVATVRACYQDKPSLLSGSEVLDGEVDEGGNKADKAWRGNNALSAGASLSVSSEPVSQEQACLQRATQE